MIVQRSCGTVKVLADTRSVAASSPHPQGGRVTTRRDRDRAQRAAEEIGARIRRVRELSGYNATRFAELIEADRNTVGRWERGAGLPDALNVEAISRVCRVSADWLLRGEASPQVAAVFTAWRSKRTDVDERAQLFLETLPLRDWIPTPVFYDLALLAYQQGLTQDEAIDAARVTEMRR
jgi:transcriptional regulator with XRE-family HTH domain